MRHIQVIVSIVSMMVLSACAGETLTPDEALYDSWVEPELGYEVTFRRDMTMSWFGEEGTWVVRESNDWADCYNVYRATCDKQIDVTLPSQNFSLQYRSVRLRQEPNTFYIDPTCGPFCTARPTAFGREITTLSLYR